MSPRQRVIEPLSRDEVLALIQAAGRGVSGVRNRALIAAGAFAGLRVAELLALKPKDVDLSAGEVHVLAGKGGRRRVVALLPEAVPYLERWLDVRGALGLNGRHPLFCSISEGGNARAKAGATSRGRALSRPYVAQMLVRLAQRAGIEKRVHPHGLRHTHAHLLALRGAMVSDIRDQLGHSSLATTSRYLGSFAAGDRVQRLRATSGGLVWSALPPTPTPARSETPREG